VLSGRAACGASGARRSEARWNALDPDSRFPLSEHDSAILQEADELSNIEQRSREMIIIKDSLDIKVRSTETQVAASLQAALQLAIALVVNISIADDELAEQITQDLLQLSRIQQVNKQSVIIKNCRKVDVSMTDTDVAVSVQLMLQLLLALLILFEVF